ncbi:DUF4112 domain-containing protein [Frigidibacter sp. MR17.24]|uniref:DUF4112 domain-containing protein n=1 Tax=Frigidibacter sp. MR17.24 TaxID=3127345 RepID=UPI00301311FA
MTSPDLAARQRSLERIARVARAMDTRFVLPGGFRLGWDGIIGLIPGVGDSIGLAVSGWMILEAHRLGAGRGTLARMVGNAAVDWALGSVPVLGDIFDIAFKSHRRNLALLQREFGAQARPADG